MANFIEKVGVGVGIVAVVYAGALVVKNGIESDCIDSLSDLSHPDAIIKCVGKEVIGGAFDDLKDQLGLGKSSGNSGKTGDFTLKNQGVIDGTASITFGTIYMDESASGKFVYQGRKGIFGNDFPGVDDSVAYYNCNGVEVKSGFLRAACTPHDTRVVAMPCTSLGKKLTGDPVKDAVDSDSIEDQTLPANQRTVETSIEPSADGKSIDKITINAGSIVYCLPHVKQSPENYAQWSNRKFNLGQFGGPEMDAYRYGMDDLITTAALASADPIKDFGEDKVKDTIATAVQGQLNPKDDPKLAAMIATAYKKGKVEVDIADPSVVQNFYKNLFAQKKAAYMDGTAKAFHPNGQSIEIDKMEIGNIVQTGSDAGGMAAR